ncbi:hypothetical protein BVRB_012130 [Beta vulgaris subsp. vulgaris]|uniref:Uncharacterized protein n=1 Tax=Beta vulgaris subsp. vulgaris TaxID=3555 RepID=A0A0J8B5M9_BETVV|nr:hypothetical protein BVRB_012130 [Beta vulgaris subsp. vulgaris]
MTMNSISPANCHNLTKWAFRKSQEKDRPTTLQIMALLHGLLRFEYSSAEIGTNTWLF